MDSSSSFYATRALRAFCSSAFPAEGRVASGNACLVTLTPNPPEQRPTPSGITQCLSWPLGKQHAGVSCWTDQGVEIECCGHGLLCCAASWLKHWGRHGTLTMNAEAVDCRSAGNLIWLGFVPLTLQICEIPHWCKHYFDAEPTAAATAGGANGYLVLQWPTDFELASLPRPDAGLARYTARSLIVTCAVEKGRRLHEEDIHYRYFAPQYGVIEDAATGSAMRVLASFWQQCDLGEALTAYQCSKEGGLLFSRIENGKVWVGGQTTIMAREIASIA